MSDRLSQLQTCLDQLVTQFFSSINFINKHHELLPVGQEPAAEEPSHEALPADKFNADLQELSKDITTKAQQIQLLIDSLPGLATSEEDQMAMVGTLEEKLLQTVEEERQVLAERRQLLERCDELILKITSEKVKLDRGVEGP